MKKYGYLLMLFLAIASCQVAPQKIDYGHEGCAYCKMTIVDGKYASQLVANTGKAYNFDAIECMINFRKENQDKQFKLFLVANFENPGQLIDANDAIYLVSDQISSPMGANLAAFPSMKNAKVKRNLYGGDIYLWKEISEQSLNEAGKINMITQY